jgi:predicted transcriptional regulator
MKYKQIEVGKTYNDNGEKRKVVYKHDKLQEVVAEINHEHIDVFDNSQYEEWTEESELPSAGLLVSENEILIYRTGEKNGYGFNSDKEWDKGKWSFKSIPHKWRPATQEEEEKFIKLLKKEAERRGLFAATKIKECLIYNQSDVVNKNNFEPREFMDMIWNQHGCIFDSGEWTEPLEDELSLQIEQLKQKAKELNLKITVTIE